MGGIDFWWGGGGGSKFGGGSLPGGNFSRWGEWENFRLVGDPSHPPSKENAAYVVDIFFIQKDRNR